MSTRTSNYAKLCRTAGLPENTPSDLLVRTLEAKLDAAAVAVGLPVGSTVEQIRFAERKQQVSLAASLRAAVPQQSARSNGVRLLTADEAREALLFGASTRHAKRRVEETEAFHGKSIRQALTDGDLR